MTATRIAAAVEGVVDEAVAGKLIEHVGCSCGDVFGKRGKDWLRNKAPAYNSAARHAPWFVLVDLDLDHQCAPLLIQSWMPKPSRYLCFRVAVREVEAWLIGDADGLSKFLAIPQGRVPRDAEQLRDPKQEMVNLAAASRRRDIRIDMTPRPGSGR